MYVEATPKIKELETAIQPYLAKSSEEDRGDGFIVGTPDNIVDYNREVFEFYRDATAGPNGKKLM